MTGGSGARPGGRGRYRLTTKMVLTIPRKRYSVIDEVTIHQNALDTFSPNVTMIIFCSPDSEESSCGPRGYTLLKKIYPCQ